MQSVLFRVRSNRCQITGNRRASKLTKSKFCILGIESSCDETAAAVVCAQKQDGDPIAGAEHGEIVSHVVYSQIEAHLPYGGVVPELAARAHVVHMDRTIDRALKEAGRSLRDMDGVAVTAGPGLIGGVLVGLTMAKALCAASGCPLIGINHLEAHALSVRLSASVDFPYLLLLISGGHTQILKVTGVGDYELWGNSMDDALGEAFDKVAKMLNLGYPGGPEVEKAASQGDPGRFKFPRPLISGPGKRHADSLDFSFSGLKTAVRLTAEKLSPLSTRDVRDICAGFQASVTDILVFRGEQAVQIFKGRTGLEAPVLVIAGGVAANRAIFAALEGTAEKHNARVVVPPAFLCTDNGAMVAWAGAERFALGQSDRLDLAARARWPLDGADMKVALR